MNVLSPHWEPPPLSGVAIGVFDGVHLGHAEVIGRLTETTQAKGLTTGVLTFDPHPVEVLAPDRAPGLLTEVERRAELLRELGVDWVATIDLNQARTMSPGKFVDEILVERASCRVISVGDDFRFGHQRAGDVAFLRGAAAAAGFEVAVVELVADQGGVISSSRIRACIGQGDVAGAAEMLGRSHRLEGLVVEGDARGRTLGFPTANIVPASRMAIPADGIYAVRVDGIAGGDAGVASLGVRPTFGRGGGRLLEVHLFDFDGDLYGANLAVDFIERLRGEVRFDSAADLVAQMEVDADDARRALAQR